MGLAVVVSLVAALPAEAHGVAVTASSEVRETAEPLDVPSLERLVAELDDAGLPSTVTVSGDRAVRSYRIHGGVSIAVPVPVAQGDPASSLIGIGYERARGAYVSFNATDQEAIVNGGGAAIAGTICIVGSPLICVVAATVVAVAVGYINAHGLCRSNRQLRISLGTLRGRCA